MRLAGAELGLWAFLANACTVVRPAASFDIIASDHRELSAVSGAKLISFLRCQLGFEHTTASRGAFLIRLSAIFTPVVASVSGMHMSHNLQRRLCAW